MSVTAYVYDQDDFPNHKVAPDRLYDEIADASGILIAVSSIQCVTPEGPTLTCTINMKDALPSGQEDALDAVVAAHDGTPLPENEVQDVNVVEADATLPSQIHGFRDMTGHNLYRLGYLRYPVTAGKHNIFMEKFSSIMYLSGGGIMIPEYEYVDGVKTEYKPEWDDYVAFDMVDVDNVLDYGKTASITRVSRSNNIATLTTSAAHSFTQGETCCINLSDDTFDDMEEAIASVPDSTHITYANAGDDVAEKDVTGSIGKIVVLAPFVPGNKVSPNEEWVCKEDDGKPLPIGIYMRFRYVSNGSTDLAVKVFYSLRT